MNISEYLDSKNVEKDLKKLIFSLCDSVKDIADLIRTDRGAKLDSENSHGDEQVEMDVLSDEIVTKHLTESGVVGLVASEEREEEFSVGDGVYAVAHDPLDGSSLIDVNLSVGSIFGIYKADTFHGVSGDDQIAAMLGVYGPRTSIFVSVADGVAYFVLDDGKFVLHRDNLSVSEEGRMFAPGNLRACSDRSEYLELLNYWAKEKYKLRYSGGMVPDIGQILLKGEGIFTYPGYGDTPDGKLRLLFECAPMAFIMEQAGGFATDCNVRIMEKIVNSLDQKSAIFIGSKNEVETVEKFLA